MTRVVRVNCPDCGCIEMLAEKVVVRICVDDDSATFRFRCTKCHSVQVVVADDSQIDVLIAVGAKSESWSIPADLRATHSGEVIDVDEVLDFRTELWDTSTSDIYKELNAY